MSNEHGYCPNCNVDLDGGLVWDTFFKQFTQGNGYWIDAQGNYTCEGRILTPDEAELRADEVAKGYGATRTKGKWGRAIAQYDIERDRTVALRCPECGHTWPRM